MLALRLLRWTYLVALGVSAIFFAWLILQAIAVFLATGDLVALIYVVLAVGLLVLAVLGLRMVWRAASI